MLCDERYLDWFVAFAFGLYVLWKLIYTAIAIKRRNQEEDYLKAILKVSGPWTVVYLLGVVITLYVFQSYCLES